jgi:cytochrome P450
VLRALANAKFGDVPFSMDEKLQTLMLFMTAGLDTVTGHLSLVVEYLGSHREAMDELTNNP